MFIGLKIVALIFQVLALFILLNVYACGGRTAALTKHYP